MGVKVLRQILHEAAIRFAALRDLDSAIGLDEAAEEFGIAKGRARVRRDKWKERQENKEETPMADGIKGCRVEGCARKAEYRPVILFAPDEGDSTDPIRVETALMDVCEAHARALGPEVYVGNRDIWAQIVQVWTSVGLEPPDPESAVSVAYEPVIEPKVNGHAPT